ncbi:hypothetical protein CDD83_10287 [Cordyceps sp. RAO-2017]|nr:hypothetical protein CDD83_10287 [Cordyceps sp. RAO-2017]
MTSTTKDTRRADWKQLNFAGTIDWGLDLQEFTSDGRNSDSDNSWLSSGAGDDVFIDAALTVQFPPSTTSLEVGWFQPSTFTGYDSVATTTRVYFTAIVTTTLTVPAYIYSVVQFSNVPIPSGINSSVIRPKTSLLAPPFIITEDQRGSSHAPRTSYIQR